MPREVPAPERVRSPQLTEHLHIYFPKKLYLLWYDMQEDQKYYNQFKDNEKHGSFQRYFLKNAALLKGNRTISLSTMKEALKSFQFPTNRYNIFPAANISSYEFYFIRFSLSFIGISSSARLRFLSFIVDKFSCFWGITLNTFYHNFNSPTCCYL